MAFWKLLDDPNPTCEVCGTNLIALDDDTFFCPKCEDELSLCGTYGTCEGIAHNGPYVCHDGKLVEKDRRKIGSGFCNTCGGGWEWA